MRILASVWDKKGLAELMLGLREIDSSLEIISTGGTQKCLVDAELQVIPIETVTGIPEGMGGRVKTLSHRIAAGLLHRPGIDDEYLTKVHGVKLDMVVVNFYPFGQTVASGADFATCIENIDIGGPTMLREAIKNHAHCLPICDPRQYTRILRIFQEAGDLNPECFDGEMRLELAAEAMGAIHDYDEPIRRYLEKVQVI